MEEWRDVNSKYQVSCQGRVRNTKTGRILKQWETGVGYRKVQVGAGRDRHRVHRLVAIAFINPPDDGLHVVHHINGIRHDNRLENLLFCTQRQNLAFMQQRI
jgi:hypothetical protein